MIALAVVPFGLAVLLHFGGPVIAGLVPPALATRLLTGLALTVALTGGLVLSIAAVFSLARLPALARMGKWSGPTLARHGSPPLWVGAVVAVMVTALLSAAVCRAARALRAGVRAQRSLRGLGSTDANLVLIDETAPIAYSVGGLAIAGVPGRIVVSTAMVRALSAPERRVLLAHEAAHLRHHHGLFVQLGEIAAAANPLLRSTARAIRGSVERWADESAAAEVGDRVLVARSLARAAVVTADWRRAGTLAVADGDVVRRVQALLAPSAPRRRLVPVVLLVAAAACWLTTGALAIHLHDLIEIAESAYAH